MNKNQLRELIADTLVEIDLMGLFSESAIELLMGTAAQESHLGEYIKQIHGPAQGIFQMEPATFRDHKDSYLKFKPKLKKRIRKACNIQKWETEALQYNLKFAICMARVHYLRVPSALPEPDDIEGLAEYWKAHYNSYLGSGTPEQFIENYKNYVL